MMSYLNKNIYTHKSTLNKTLSAFKELKDEKLRSVCKPKLFMKGILKDWKYFQLILENVSSSDLCIVIMKTLENSKRCFLYEVIKIIVIQTLEKLASEIRFLLMYFLLINLNRIPLYFQQECEYYQEGEGTISFSISQEL